MRQILRSKIHKAIVIFSDLNYIGSITIDKYLIEKADFLEWEKVLVVSNTTWERIETYIIPWEEKSWDIGINWAAAHKIGKWEEIIIMGFELSDEPIISTNILVDENNKFIKYL